MLQVPAILQWLIIYHDVLRSQQLLQLVDGGIEFLSLDARGQHGQFALSLRDAGESLILPHSCFCRIGLVGKVCGYSGMTIFRENWHRRDRLIVVWSHDERIQAVSALLFEIIAALRLASIASLILDCFVRV